MHQDHANYDVKISLRDKLIFSHLTVALFCFIALAAALFFNIWLGERSRSLATVANPTQQFNLQQLNNSVKHSVALIFEKVALPSTTDRGEWETLWDEDIWLLLDSLNKTSDPTNNDEYDLVQQLRQKLVTLETRQWNVIDVLASGGNYPAEVLLDNEAFYVAQDINRGLDALIDREAERRGERTNISTVKKFADLRASFARLFAALNRFASDASVIAENEINVQRESIAKLLKGLQSNSTLPQIQRDLLAWLQQEFQFYSYLAERIIAIRKSAEWNVAQFILLNKVIPLTNQVSSLLEQLMRNTAEKITLSSEKLSPLIEYNLMLSVLLLTMMLSSAYIAARHLSRKIVAPLEGLVDATQKLQSEHQAAKIPEDGNDELGLLAKTFNRMQEALLEKQQELKHLATIDPLTQLANRHKFLEVIDREWKHSFRNKNSIAVIMIDVDYFKQFNDEYGHQAGDEALSSVANAIRECLHRPVDLGVRYGGEEFVVVLPETELAGARKIALKIQACLARKQIPAATKSDAGFLSISCGIAACCPDDKTGWEQLVKTADDALYQAKAKGRNQICDALS